MSTPGRFPETIFRAYDIRGRAGDELTPERVARLGRAFAVYFHQHGARRVVLGRDGRLTSPLYHGLVARALLASGLHVLDMGLAPTPVFYFTLATLGIGAGVMVTASHNPRDDNGFKIWCGAGAIHGDEVQRLRALAENGETREGRGFLSLVNPFPAYRQAVMARVDQLARPVRVVVDGGNGAAGEACAELLEGLGAEVIRQFCEPDGSFPHHHPDPAVAANMRQLKSRVRQEGADFGVGLDGDGDRLGVVNERGELLFGDEVAGILAAEALAQHPGGVILGDVKCSRHFFAFLEGLGGQARMCPVGHSIIKARMRQENAIFAGDMSGHLYFGAPGWHGVDDALYAACRLAALAARLPKGAGLHAPWPRDAVTPELFAPCAEGDKGRVMEKVMTLLAADGEVAEHGHVTCIDGARVDFPDGWFLIRPSNTQAAMVMRCEAVDRERLAALRRRACRLLAAAGVDVTPLSEMGQGRA